MGKNGNALVNASTIETSINNIAFDSIWRGTSQYNLISSLKRIVTASSKERGKINSYFSALNDLNKYKANKEKIRQLRSRLSWTPNTKNNEGERAAIQSEINALENENQQLRTSIEAVMASITSIGPITSAINYNVELDYTKYTDELLSKYSLNPQPGQVRLAKLGDYQSLGEFYNRVDENGNIIKGSGMQYINDVIDEVQSTYTGREAAVNSALAMLKLASDKGVKLDYQHKGTDSNPYVTNEDVASGVDCNPFASWVVDKGTPNGFQWRSPGLFQTVGKRLQYNEWSTAQPGDVFTSSGHVGVIIENDPANNRFVVAHASGDNIGILLQYKTYSELMGGGFSVMDMTSVYDGTENTNRKAFGGNGIKP